MLIKGVIFDWDTGLDWLAAYATARVDCAGCRGIFEANESELVADCGLEGSLGSRADSVSGPKVLLDLCVATDRLVVRDDWDPSADESFEKVRLRILPSAMTFLNSSSAIDRMMGPSRLGFDECEDREGTVVAAETVESTLRVLTSDLESDSEMDRERAEDGSELVLERALECELAGGSLTEFVVAPNVLVRLRSARVGEDSLRRPFG